MEVGMEKIVGRIQYLFKIAFPPALPIFLFHFPRGHLFPSQIKRKRIQPSISSSVERSSNSVHLCRYRKWLTRIKETEAGQKKGFRNGSRP